MGTPLDRHLVLVGFMGAGKTTLGMEAGRRTGLRFADVDAAVEHEVGDSIPDFFATHGEMEFRRIEEELTVWHLGNEPEGILSLGGGAVTSPAVRDALRAHAVTVWVDIDVDSAWERARGTDRPLAQDEHSFRRLFEERRALYEEVADVTVRDVDGVVLAAGGVHVETGSLGWLGELVPGAGPVALVADRHVAGIYGMEAQLGLGSRKVAVHEVPSGEEAKTPKVLERLWRALRLERGGTLVALGGGCTTDVAGLAAATYLRGVDWVAVPTTLVGQVDAAIGGKTAIDLPEGKNLVGAFHWPVRTVIDPALLETLPEAESLNGRA
ncbi:MAG TPA: iron-containing alcohol dehydrogenase, partial [Gaiellaceae bacterium]|nr:iron-containing alcohol dehydrogenase [Gaiellaceae bacterium]